MEERWNKEYQRILEDTFEELLEQETKNPCPECENELGGFKGIACPYCGEYI